MVQKRTTRSAGKSAAAEARRLGDADYQALADFRRAMREFLTFSAEGATDHGLTSQQHQALLAIRAHRGEEPISVGALAECLSIKNHSAIGLVARLVDRGVAVRSTSAIDRRRSLVELTPAGHSALEEISLRNLERLGVAATILEGLLKTTRRLKATSAQGVGRRR